MLKNTTLYIYEELRHRGVEVEIIDEGKSLMRFKSAGGTWRLLRSCMNDHTSAVGRYICDHKDVSLVIARMVDMPVVPDSVYHNDEQAMEFIQKHGPIVVKPVSGAHGHGVTVAITEKEQLHEAVLLAQELDPSGEILLQKMVEGEDARLLVIGGRYAAAVRRVPAHVVGDGIKNVRKLIEAENHNNPKRVTGYTGTLRQIDIEAAEKFLGKDIKKIPKDGESMQVIGTSNTSMGGHAVDFTDDVPKEIIAKTEALAAQLHLPTCGVDFLIDSNKNYYFLEVNGSPGFGPHIHPHEGKSRNVTKIYVDWLLST